MYEEKRLYVQADDIKCAGALHLMCRAITLNVIRLHIPSFFKLEYRIY